MHVAAADAGVFDVDKDIVGALDFGDRAVFELDIVGLVEDEGEVLEACSCQKIGWCHPLLVF